MPCLLAATAALMFSGCTAPAGDSVVADEIVAMKDFKFDTLELRILAGETVQWVNEDAMAHTVTPADKALWGTEGSGDAQDDWIAQGDSWSFTFTEPGTYQYYCIPHAAQGDDGEWKGMVATVIVEASA